MDVREITYRNHHLNGRSEGYRNAADSIETILGGEGTHLASLTAALLELVEQLREQAEEDER